MADLQENDAAHANLLSETLGIDLKKSEKVKETAEKNDPSMPDLLSQLANSKVKRSAKKSNDKTFDVADDGPAQLRADRAAKYKNAISKDMDKWEAIARANERKTGVIFPLTSNDSKAIKKQFGKEASSKTENHSYAFKPRYDYEKELENLYNASENLIKPDSKTGLTEFEKKMIQHLSSKEAKERIANLRKKRFLISSQEAKNQRVKKIKSKNFRRRQRKIKEKEEEKLLKLAEEQALQGKNVKEQQEGIDKLAILQAEKDRVRALERASLRHKHTSKKVKEAKQYAKYNDEQRQEIAERENLHRELVTQGKELIDEEEAFEEEEFIPGEKLEEQEKLKEKIVSADEQALNTVKNLFGDDSWLGAEGSSKTTKNALASELAEELELETGKEIKDQEDLEDDQENDDEDQEEESELGLEHKETKRIAELLSENREKQGAKIKSALDNLSAVPNFEIKEDQLSTKEQPTENQPSPPKKSKLLLQDLDLTENKELLDEQNNQILSIQEAFMDDEIADDFEDEKAALLEEAVNDKLADSSLPGWGSWGGPVPVVELSKTQLKKQRKKERRERNKKMKELQDKRRDKDLNHVIINDAAIKKQLEGLRPENIPFPFTSIEQYEKSLRMPLGKMFNTHEGSKLLTRPDVVTKQGRIIAPIKSEDAFDGDNLKVKTGKKRKIISKEDIGQKREIKENQDKIKL